MRKKILFVFVLIFVFSFYNFVFSDVNINEEIDLNSQIIAEDTQENLDNDDEELGEVIEENDETDEDNDDILDGGDNTDDVVDDEEDVNNFLNINVKIDVPKTCEAIDTDGISHTYGDGESYLAICALSNLLEEDYVSSIGLSNQYPSMGLFVTSFNDVLTDPFSEYWALYLNGSYAETGITNLVIKENDIISFKLSDFAGVETGDFVIIEINSLITDINDENLDDEEDVSNDEEILENEEENENNENNESIGGSSHNSNNKKEFDIEKAFEFLISKQNNDGSFYDPMYTDWSAIALSLKEGIAKEKIKEYLLNNDIDSSTITDYERRAMALMSLDINPYDDTGVDYIKKIIDSFDGEQIGESSLINDDIFGIIVLKNVNFNEDDEIIKKTIENILKYYEAKNFESVDIASALFQSLHGFEDIEGVNDLKNKIEDYILSSLSSINNPFSASWVLQSGVERNKSEEYLIDNQNEDGGINVSIEDIDYRVWATSYAIPAILGKNWDDILIDFEKEDYGKSNVLIIENDEIKKIEEVVLINIEEEKIEEILVENKIEEKKEIKVAKKQEKKEEKIINEINVETREEIENEFLINNEDLVANTGASEFKFENYLLIGSSLLFLIALFKYFKF